MVGQISEENVQGFFNLVVTILIWKRPKTTLLFLEKVKQNTTKQQNLIAVCFYHVTYAFQNESTLYICPNVMRNSLLETGEKCEV